MGATHTVTGSKYLLEEADTRIMIDCGLFQGYKELRLRNWDRLPVDPASIDAIILTHAHIDHTGYIPLIVKNGFRGKIYCSSATYDLCSILLPDSGFLHEEDARRANQYGYTKHHPALPLYTEKDARDSLKQFQVVGYGTPHQIGDFTYTLSRSGHILGSSFITISNGHRTLTFSGDLGRPHTAIMRNPAKLTHTDYLVLESTYGDRLHDRADPQEMMGKIINETVAKGGSVIIPSFAVGRAQTILYYLYKLKQSNSIPDIPIYLDSPMAINATKLLCKHDKDHHLSEQVCEDVCSVAKYTRTVQESKTIEASNVPCIIISASGMATGGRILHHLKAYITNHRNTILFTGYQAGGTRGDRIVRGEKEIKIHGDMFPVRARIENLSMLSAHADYEEILQWLSHFEKPPIKVFLTHGEEQSALSLKEKIESRFGWNVVIPTYMQSEEL